MYTKHTFSADLSFLSYIPIYLPIYLEFHSDLKLSIVQIVPVSLLVLFISVKDLMIYLVAPTRNLVLLVGSFLVSLPSHLHETPHQILLILPSR